MNLDRHDFIELTSIGFLEKISFLSTQRYFIVWSITFVALLTASFFVRLPLVEKLPGEILIQDERRTHSSIRSGVVSEILVEVGDSVTENQAVIVMRSSELPTKLDMQLRRGELEERKRIQANVVDRLNLEITRTRQAATNKISQIERNISSEENTLERLQAELEVGKTELRDLETLRSSGLATSERLRTIETQIRSLEISIRNNIIARDGLQSELMDENAALELTLNALELDISKSQIEEALLDLELQSLEVAHEWVIAAQFPGVVSALQVSVGDTVQQGASAVSILPENSTPRIEFYQSSNTRLTVTKGAQVKIAIDAYPTQNYGLFSAELVQVGRSAEHQIPQLDKSGILTEQPSYRHIALFKDTSELPKLEDGYSAIVSVLVEDRSVFDWLISPFFLKEY